jgi:hypothetical protein
MKLNLLLSSIAISAIIFTNTQLFGQNPEEEISNLKIFGMGMHIEQFKLADITMDISTAPANKIVFTITPSKNYRLEPEIGFSFLNDKENELKDKSIILGIGGFGMYQRGKTNIYGGLRFEYANISNEYNDYNTGDIATEKTNRIAIGPAIGAEYYFGEHFSIGGEIGFKYMTLNTKDSQFSDGEVKQDFIATDSGLLLRFYF